MASINNPFKTDEVVGSVPSGTRSAVVDALTRESFTLEILEGPTDADKIDIEGDDLVAKVMRVLQQGEERDALESFRQHLLDGDDVIRVIEVGDRAELAGKILSDHGGETIWHYGQWTYRKLNDPAVPDS